MQDIDVDDIEVHISKPRLRSYVQLAGSNDTAKLIGAYQWNKRVASALYPIIQCLEVTLRNAIHAAAKQHFNNSDWYDPLTKIAGNDKYQKFTKKYPHQKKYFYRDGVSSGKRGSRKKWLSKHEKMLKDAKDKLIRSGQSVSADAVIGELMFGFWVGLFETHYNDIHSKNRLWPHLGKKVFPNLKPADRVFSKIHTKLENIKKLRNRLSHHEPVWKHKSVSDSATAVQYLNSIVSDIVSLIDGISTHRRKLLFQSGKISYFQGICSEECLSHYLEGTPNQKVDKRRLKRYVEKAVRQPQAAPIVVTDRDKPILIVDLWQT